MNKNKKAEVLSRLHRQRPWLSLLAVLLGFTLLAGSTYSWFTRSYETSNILKTQTLRFSFQVEEEFTPPETVEPGQKIIKVADAKNTGDIPGFVRMLVLAEIVSADGTLLEAIPGVTFTFEELNVTDWSFGNTKMWADGGDGYYYYLDKLDPGETTGQHLFGGVPLSAGLDPEYENAEIKIEIKVEASETIREKYRGGWWGDGGNPPVDPDLILIDNILKELAK